MSRFRKLSHSIYECKYHIVFIPNIGTGYLVGREVIMLYSKITVPGIIFVVDNLSNSIHKINT